MTKKEPNRARPIFIVGSPRSGTSILAWCLGQHPNILPLEESDWLGPFAVQAAALHAVGSARGERSLLSAMGIDRDEFLRDFGAAIDGMIGDHRARLERNNWLAAQADPAQVSAGFAVARGADEPKARWVDGTPEYSLYICGLMHLFPGAKFVHILREVEDVAASLLGFRQQDGSALVADADAACEYWLRTVRACVLGEQALGPRMVHRIRHCDLVAAPEPTLRGVLEFLGETWAPACLEPLSLRINSSRPAEDAPVAISPGQSTVVDKALRLSAELQRGAVGTGPSAEARARLDAEFAERVGHARRPDQSAALAQALTRVEARFAESAAHIARLRRRLNICGLLFALLALGALAVLFDGIAGELLAGAILVCALIYAALRRAGLRHLLGHLFGRRRAD